jgi:hypothetical protein
MPRALPLPQQKSRDDKAGNHEEYVDADESTFQPRDSKVVEHNEKNRNGPKTLDIRPVVPIAWSGSCLVA